MNTFHTHFSQLMAETLELAAATDMPLADIAAKLFLLADAERALPLEAAPANQLRRTAGTDIPEASRFAVYAWADEQLLHAQRPDAASWAGRSLQMRYCRTAAAGNLFYDHLAAELDACGIAREEGGKPLSLAQRLARAAANPPALSALPAFTCCLLYGFRGKYYTAPEILQELRAASQRFLTTARAQSAAELTLPPTPKKSPAQLLLQHLEPVLLVLIPVVLTIAFDLFCTALLTGLPTDFHS